MSDDDPTEGDRGCPKCVAGESSYYWSGAIISVREVLAGGFELLEDRDEGAWRVEAKARCTPCGAVWHFEYRYPGRPPLFLKGVVVD